METADRREVNALDLAVGDRYRRDRLQASILAADVAGEVFEALSGQARGMPSASLFK